MFDNDKERNAFDPGDKNEYNRQDSSNINGEYRFVKPDEPYSASFKDAGFIPQEDAPVTPKTYYTPAEKPEKKEKEPKDGQPNKRRGGLFAGIVTLCLVCSILGGVGGAVIAREYWPAGSAIETAAPLPTPTPTLASDKTPAVTTAKGGTLTGSQVYDLAITQVVGVSSEITYTNIFGQKSASSVSGTGFVVSDDGYIMTNYHVIEAAYRGGYTIDVMFYDGTSYEASVVGFEADNDVAVLKIDAAGLNPVILGDSDQMKVGETVYAVGNPLGELTYTMTSGMISALDREISTDTNVTINMFQIDAAVNSGNSGGPVYNSRGQVLGIVTAKYSESGVEGLGFAIPINDAISIANELITKGYVSGKAYIGVSVDDVPRSVAQYYNLKPGAYVIAVEPGKSAEQAGIRAGDIIIRLGDSTVTSVADLTSAKKKFKAGDTTEIEVYRNGETLTLTLTFGEDVPEKVTQNDSASPTQSPQSKNPAS